MRLTAFLISVAVFEAVLNAEQAQYAQELTETERDALRAPLRTLPIPGPTAGAQLYAGEGLPAFAGPHRHPEQAHTPSTRWWAHLAPAPPR